MKRFVEYFLVLTLLAALIGIGWTLGWRQASIGLVFSLVWFIIAVVLLSRPPGIPKITQGDTSSDLPMVTRTDPLTVLPLAKRLRISLSVSVVACLIVWVALYR